MLNHLNGIQPVMKTNKIEFNQLIGILMKKRNLIKFLCNFLGDSNRLKSVSMWHTVCVHCTVQSVYSVHYNTVTVYKEYKEYKAYRVYRSIQSAYLW